MSELNTRGTIDEYMDSVEECFRDGTAGDGRLTVGDYAWGRRAYDLRYVLQNLEWDETRGSCNICGMSQKDGHATGCELDAVLRLRP